MGTKELVRHGKLSPQAAMDILAKTEDGKFSKAYEWCAKRVKNPKLLKIKS